ncbi:MAG: hypothetical protein ACP5UF_03900 [Hydrogenobaculum sp.]
MRNLIVSAPRLLTILGAVVFVGANMPSHAEALPQHTVVNTPAKSTQSYLVAEDNGQQKEDSEDNSNDSSDSDDE